MSDTAFLRLTINGEERAVAAPVHHTLLEVLREECGLTGTKHGCELGECGTCTVLLDGRPVLSCLVVAAEAQGRPIETVEGMQTGNRLHPLQAAFLEHDSFQCGYCTPGQIVSAFALLSEPIEHTDEAIRENMSGNICRCGAYPNIVNAVRQALSNRKEGA